MRLYGRSGISTPTLATNVYYNGSAWVRDNATYGSWMIYGDSNGAIHFATHAATDGFPGDAMIIQTAGGAVSFNGTFTNDNAAAQIVGEYGSSAIASGSAVSLTTATAANVTSISLTHGDWDVEGNINFAVTSATVTATSGGIGTTSVTVPTDGTEVFSGLQTTTTTETDSITIPRRRVSIASTTTVYLVGKTTFSAGTVAGFGSISARRVR
jgi:hypothetical protein